MKTVENRVKDVIAQQLGLEVSTLAAEDNLANLGADSLDAVEIMMELEEEFDVDIPDDSAEKLTTVGAVVRYIEDKANA